ncbi:MAG: flagellar protein [Lachnospiraceae bacterium]|nr:flagellar protein [Lachnospiraceae bacterium]
MDRLQSSFISIEQAKDAYLGNGKSKPQTGSVSDGTDFRSILENACGNDYSDSKVTFSKHANERLESRNINLSDDQLDRLNKGIMQAKEKSINESLVMMDNIAFIVNVKNNTVITAMEQESDERNVFTNIDGAVIV